ncbi:anti-sigma factor [Aquabacterium sp. A7-Y]|uniref:anti-sigma factor n=1 Tax=Aquabacterium sp. A7-Y TaxID=1349605 RepID=UPI00223CA45F|nr:anti-sigma factor [Aquabacterium sp. A7-Y]MCW7540469.1 anti-sigma factor [Aquabacterium sp. A7-Y]
MNYTRADLADRLAAEYVLGTLHGPARHRFEVLLPAHPVLRQAVRGWEAQLAPLMQAVPPVEPSPEVWQRIEAALARRHAVTSPARAPAQRRWNSLVLWRGWALFASAVTACLTLLLTRPPPSRPPLVVVLTAPEGAQSFVAGINADRRSMEVRPLVHVTPPSGRDLQLWVLPPGGAPRSLGLISPDRATVLRHPPPPRGADTLAVTLEPAGGSPSGAPTGPVLYSGRLQL